MFIRLDISFICNRVEYDEINDITNYISNESLPTEDELFTYMMKYTNSWYYNHILDILEPCKTEIPRYIELIYNIIHDVLIHSPSLYMKNNKTIIAYVIETNDKYKNINDISTKIDNTKELFYNGCIGSCLMFPSRTYTDYLLCELDIEYELNYVLDKYG